MTSITVGCQRCRYRMALDKVRIWERHNAQTELASAIARVKNELAAPTLKADEIFAPEATSHGDMRSRLLDALPDGGIEEQVLLAQARDIRIPEEKARELLAALLANGTLCEPRPGWLVKV